MPTSSQHGLLSDPQAQGRMPDPAPVSPSDGTLTNSARMAKPAAPSIKSPKARHADECQRLEQLPNIGPAMAGDLRALGIHHPRELATRDPLALYQALCSLSGKRQDPCVLDTFMAATDFMRGATAAPWWAYTRQRKQRYGNL